MKSIATRVAAFSVCFSFFFSSFSIQCLAGSNAVGSLYDLKFSDTWQDENAQKVEWSNWKGHRLIIAMAYTFCRGSCPLTMRRLKAEQKRFENQIREVESEILFVTIDPDNDVPDRMKKFKQNWEIQGKNWHFLRSSEEDTRKLSRFLNIRFENIDGHITHDNKVVEVDETGKVIGSNDIF